ncbi:hypothetical protein LZ189_19725, partial [Rhodovulum sulfidophilum]|nr:hypothetical protein [Rhodovulum sulfidophilum]
MVLDGHAHEPALGFAAGAVDLEVCALTRMSVFGMVDTDVAIIKEGTLCRKLRVEVGVDFVELIQGEYSFCNARLVGGEDHREAGG